MFKLFIGCVIIAIIAAIFGFGGVSEAFAGIAKVIFFIFIVGAIIAFLLFKKIF
ncbi:DUF1328 domain-containing protein [Gelidibacter salicanalis]|uniref:DUF1328 domain-containing protein n=1 Tax=Gelidibacter salicanalis TaxID=291193 RepID=A0A5C7APR6_9FLAO|nr:DUF1328 family protein [Gelidibacter salicanalis]TXE10776.1 DUF1328 domain-containing protein [Gelidibacter salicanalis]